MYYEEAIAGYANGLPGFGEGAITVVDPDSIYFGLRRFDEVLTPNLEISTDVFLSATTLGAFQGPRLHS